MRIAGFEVRRSRRVKLTIEQKVVQHLATQEVRELIARMARSEVKNYMAECAELAGLPFSTPAAFLAYIRGGLATLGAAELVGPFGVGGYANHPEQAEQDARPWPPSDGLTFSDELLDKRVTRLEQAAGYPDGEGETFGETV